MSNKRIKIDKVEKEETNNNNNNNNNEKEKEKDNGKEEEKNKQRKLIDIFIVPPLTVLDVKQGYWKKQRKMWFEEYGIGKTCAGREENALNLSKLLAKKQKTTSVFDPVVCEIAYKWFSNLGDTVYDPFAGGAVRGMVACFTKRNYTGVDIRKDQVEENKHQLHTSEMASKFTYSNYTPEWIEIDAKYYAPEPYDLLFTCPPYFNLEKYSSLEGDLSNMPFDKFLQSYETILKITCETLKNNRFAVIVIGDVRGGDDGIYLKLPERTIEIMEKYNCKLYNKMILLQEPATGAMRAFNYMNSSRKIATVHQNMFVFVKGSPKLATERLEPFK